MKGTRVLYMNTLVKTTLSYPKLYLVHKSGKPLVWPAGPDRHAIVSFSSPAVALTVASYTESHYITHKEWPDGVSFSFKKQVIPTILGVTEEEFGTIAELCSMWNMKLIIVDELLSVNKHTKSFNGDVRDFDTDNDALVTHLNSLLE